jgi:hypothetical protein
MTDTIVSTESIREYFRSLLGEVKDRQNVHLGEVTEFYVANLLADFLSAEKLYITRDDGSREFEPLAFLMAKAVQASREERIRTLRRLGDVSLYVSGFFSDSLQGQLVDVDYYISMGESAYGQIATMMRDAPARESSFSDLYDELCSQFPRIVDVFGEISERVAVSTNKGIVRLYERWMKTGSERLTKLLAEQGVVPIAKPRFAS